MSHRVPEKTKDDFFVQPIEPVFKDSVPSPKKVESRIYEDPLVSESKLDEYAEFSLLNQES